MVPESEFFPKSNKLSWVILDTQSGMVPVNEFLYKSSDLSVLPR